jgi:hypothetical protein
MLAAGTVPVLLRLITSHQGDKKRKASEEEDDDEKAGEEEAEDEAGAAAFKPLRLIAYDPRGEAAIAAADCAGPLVAALAAVFKLPLGGQADAGGDESRGKTQSPAEGCVGKSGTRDVSTLSVRKDVVAVIGKLIEGRPRLGQAFLSAGIVRELGNLLGPARTTTERGLAMQLAEKLVQHVPLACQVMRAEGIFMAIHRLTVPAATASQKRGSHRDVGTGESNAGPLKARGSLRDEGDGGGTPSLKPTRGFSEAEAAQAAALMSMSAAHCGGVLEIGKTPDGVPIRYTGSSVTVSNLVLREDTPPTDTSAPRPSRKVCCMCGAASEKALQVCMRCRSARYCGRTCQAAHWPVHKTQCRG